MLWQRVLEIRRLRQNDPIKYKHPVNDVAILIGVMFCVKLGTETPFTTRNGYRMLYCYNPATGKHAYLTLQIGIIMDNEEVQNAMR